VIVFVTTVCIVLGAHVAGRLAAARPLIRRSIVSSMLGSAMVGLGGIAAAVSHDDDDDESEK
jgi:hypothetical protein